MEKLSGQGDDVNTPSKTKKTKKFYWIFALLLLCGIGGYYYYQASVDNSYTYDGEIATDVLYTFSQEEEDRWLTIDEFKAWDTNYKAAVIRFLEENNHSTDGYYFLTRIPERAKNVYCFGNFSGDAINGADLAYIAEYHDFSTSRLVITDKDGNLLFTKAIDGHPVVSAIKKGVQIYKGSTELVPLDVDGILVKDTYNTYAYVFDKKSKQFQNYYQYSAAEIEEYNNPSEGYDESEESSEDVDPQDTTSAH